MALLIIYQGIVTAKVRTPRDASMCHRYQFCCPLACFSLKTRCLARSCEIMK
jgi:hypothetical protein